MSDYKVKTDNKLGYIVFGTPAKGCQQCVKGEKLVLFITGLCGQRCSYCPVSEKKFSHDDVYANEWKIKNLKELVKEIELTSAKGCGITGGDPLVKTDRTCSYIKFLKKKYGKKFHVHLYTPFKLVTKDKLDKLSKAGLDEIRFHPDIDSDKDWHKIELALNYGWDVGLEIPSLPDKLKETKKLLDYFADKVKFINLNELEFSDTTVSHYKMKKSYKTKNTTSYGAKGSDIVAKKIIEYANKKKYQLSVYYCTAFLKDRTQMGNRIKRRAKKVAKEYDEITDEGMIIRGAIYLPELQPGVGYREKLKSANKSSILKKLVYAKEQMVKKTNLGLIDIDEIKLRLTLSVEAVKEFSDDIKSLGLAPAIVEEYPTHDAVEVEIDML